MLAVCLCVCLCFVCLRMCVHVFACARVCVHARLLVDVRCSCVPFFRAHFMCVLGAG